MPVVPYSGATSLEGHFRGVSFPFLKTRLLILLNDECSTASVGLRRYEPNGSNMGDKYTVRVTYQFSTLVLFEAEPYMFRGGLGFGLPACGAVGGCQWYATKERYVYFFSHIFYRFWLFRYLTGSVHLISLFIDRPRPKSDDLRDTKHGMFGQFVLSLFFIPSRYLMPTQLIANAVRHGTAARWTIPQRRRSRSLASSHHFLTRKPIPSPRRLWSFLLEKSSKQDVDRANPPLDSTWPSCASGRKVLWVSLPKVSKH